MRTALQVFNFYKQMKKSAIRALMTTGMSAREAINELKTAIPYAFAGLSEVERVENSFPDDMRM